MRRLAAGLLVLLAACGGGDVDPVEAGRRAYSAHCISCHHIEPSLDGTVGPAIAGSSRELLEARVLRAEYPDGYAPKRSSQQMPPMPYLAHEIEALAAYLQSGF